MKLAILTEAEISTGIGHLMRCSAIAEAFRQTAMPDDLLAFIVHDDKKLRPTVESCQAQSLQWRENKGKLLQALHTVDAVVVDSYKIDASLLQIIAEHVPVRVFLDDLLRNDYPPGFVLNPSLKDTRQYPKDNEVEYLLGPDFALLRPVFWDLKNDRHYKLPLGDSAPVLITVGGSDPEDLTTRIMNVLDKYNRSLERLIVVGPGFKNQKAIENDVRVGDRLLHSPDSRAMLEAIQSCSYAITAGGQSTFELAHCRRPMIIIQTAANQNNNCMLWQDLEACLFAGDLHSPLIDTRILQCLERMADPGKRERIASNASRAVDGQGPRRLIHTIRESLGSVA